MSFSYDLKNGNRKVVYSSEEGRLLDREVWEMMEHFDQLLPASLKQRRNSYEFLYDITGTTNLRAWQADASPSRRAQMERKKTEAFRNLVGAGISARQIMQEERYMYVENATDAIKLICIPLVTESLEDEPPAPSSDQPLDLYLSPDEKMVPPPAPAFSTVEEPDSHPGLDYPSKEEMDSLSDPDFFSEEKMDSHSDPGFFSEEEMDSHSGPDFSFGEEADSHSVPVPQLSSDSGLKDWQTDSTEQVPCEDEDDGTVLYRADPEDDEKTVLLIPHPSGRAKLVRLETQESFPITENVTVIGRKKAAADIFLKGNPTIGREHCRILYRERKYYLEDSHSTNGTWLDGTSLEPEMPVLLHDKSEIRLSNESFIFENEEEES